MATTAEQIAERESDFCNFVPITDMPCETCSALLDEDGFCPTCEPEEIDGDDPTI